MPPQENQPEQPDFESHVQAAVAAYLRVQPFYEDLANVVARVLEECLKKRNVKIHSVQHRAKGANSFKRKAAIPSDVDPNAPKYGNPSKKLPI